MENVIIGKLIPAATGMRRYRSVKLTYKGQNIEGEAPTVEGPLPEWAPEELKEIEALLPVRPEPQPEELFGDFDFDDAGDIDVSAFAGVTFDPTAEVIGDAFDDEIVLEEIVASPAEPISGDLESVTLGEIGVSTRWVNKFVEAGVTSVADLKGKSEDDLLNLPGIGQKAVEEVRAGLETHGLVNLLV
jgi:DNA-directed RNA polymerase subunit beta'